jgi:hypothetical protein
LKMPQPPKPVGRRLLWDRQSPTRFERVFSYCVISIIVVLGVLILAGAFGISSQFRGILGVVLIGYGLIRLLLMKTRFDRHNEKRHQGVEEANKGDRLKL